MRLNAILLSVCALISLTASAQDKIYKRNGDVINGKVKEVNQKSVSYKRQDNPDGPDYVINRSEVTKIQYQNGSEDYMSNSPHRDDRAPEHHSEPKPQIHYGGNIISAALINLNEHGYGVGLAYERSLDKRGVISLYLPVNVCLGGIGNDTYYDPLLSGNITSPRRRTIWQFMPGAKFYPTGNQGKVRYAVGPQLVYETGTIEREQYLYDPTFPGNAGFYRRDDVKIQKFGVMINNSVNMFPSRNLFIGIDFGIGIPYSWEEESLLTGQMEAAGNESPMVQLNFRLGFRI
jgi:hypothetical protein